MNCSKLIRLGLSQNGLDPDSINIILGYYNKNICTVFMNHRFKVMYSKGPKNYISILKNPKCNNHFLKFKCECNTPLPPPPKIKKEKRVKIKGVRYS